MKYFSFDYRLFKEDYKNYYKDFRKINFMIILRKALIPALFLVFISFFILNSKSDKMIYVTFFAFLIISAFFPHYYSKKISMSLVNSKHGQKEVRLDFYGDHIEIHVPEADGCRCTSQRHLKLNGFTMVAESESSFYFSYMNEKMLIIPKRAINEEIYQKLKNLINNYFGNIYMTV